MSVRRDKVRWEEVRCRAAHRRRWHRSLSLCTERPDRSCRRENFIDGDPDAMFYPIFASLEAPAGLLRLLAELFGRIFAFGSRVICPHSAAELAAPC